MSSSLRAPLTNNSLRRKPQYYSQTVRNYYVKQKERKGPSVRAWISFGVALVTSVTGAVIYLGKFPILDVVNKK